jgi:hypothetical protein
MLTTHLRKFVWAVCLALLPYSVQAKTTDSLVTDLRIMLGQIDSTNSTWTNTELRRCLNLSQDYISGLGRVVEKSDTLAGGNIRITYPSDFKQLRPVPWLWRNGKEVRPLPVIALDSMYKLVSRVVSQAVGLDNFYVADEGTALIVVPPLSSADSVVIQYYAQPSVLSGVVECGFGPEWEAVLLVGAKAVALEKSRDVGWYDRAIAERDRMIGALYQQTKLKPQLPSVP